MSQASFDGPGAVPPPAGSTPGPSPTFLIMALGRELRARVEDQLRARGLSMRHLSALGHLAHDPGSSYSELARRAGVTAQSMQATLRQLEDLGAVERRSPPGRGHAAHLHVTDHGTELRQWAQLVLSEIDRWLLDRVPEDQRPAMVSGLLAAFTDVVAARDTR